MPRKRFPGVFPYRDGYRADVSLGTDPATGKRRRQTVTGATERAVDDARRVLLDRHQRGIDVAAGRQTVKDFLIAWLRDVVKPTARPGTFRVYEQVCRVHLIPALGRTPLAALTPQQVQAMLTARVRAGLAPNTVAGIRGVLRTALSQAVRWELVTRNVAQLVTVPKPPRPPDTMLSADEARRLFDATASERLGPLYSVTLALGMRQGEAIGLRWQDMDLDGGLIHVRQQLQYQDGALTACPPKTPRSRRTFRLPAAAIGILRAHRERQTFERRAAGDGWQESGLVFTTPSGGPVSPRAVRRDFQRLLVAAGLPAMKFHTMRHCCVSLLLAQGVPPRVVMEMLGHSSLTQTMTTYAHISVDQTQAAADAMDRVLGG